ncbi:MAG: DUF2207 family protein [Actinomycetota bacterium]
MASKTGLPGWVGWLILLVVLAAIVLPIGIPIWIAVSQKSYEFPEVRIDATLQPDGSLDLVEKRTFDFEGEFSFAFFTVDWPVERIQNFTVREGGRELQVDESGSTSYQFNGQWGFAAEDEERTFTISYTARCAVDVWADAAHLNWQFIGTGWDVPTEHAFVRLHLPGAATTSVERPGEVCPETPPSAAVETRPLNLGEMQAWGHGTLGGEVRLPDPQTVTLDVRELPAFTFVEGSILFPETVVPLAYQVPAPMRDQIASTEATLAEAANAQRRALLAIEAGYERRKRILWGWIGVTLTAFVLLPPISRIRDRVRGVPKTLQSPPEDIHPVELAQLWAGASGRFGMSNVYRTQMLHLAHIGAIELQAVGPVSDPADFRVRMKDLKNAEPKDLEFLEFLFPDKTDDDIALSSLKPKGERKKQLREWWEVVDTSGKSMLRGLVPELRWESLTTTLIGIAGLVGGVLMSALVNSPIGLILIPISLVGMAIAHILIRPRIGEAARERVAKWRAFRRFLQKFSSLPEAPALAVVIWEQYLVYATALGVADEVEKQVKALIPEQELPSPWKGAPSGVSGLSFIHTFNTVPVHSAASAAVHTSISGGSSIGSFSSSSGGGGGFSSGGGGGGGGTGGGAG